MGERSCGEQANQRAGDPAGFLLAPGGSSRRMRLSLSAESYVYFSLPTRPPDGDEYCSELRQAV